MVRTYHTLLVVTICVLVVSIIIGCGGTDVAPPSGGGSAVDLGGGMSLRVLDVGSLHVQTDIYQNRVYTTLDGTEITYFRAVHKAEGNLIAYYDDASHVVVFSAFFPPAAGGGEWILGPYDESLDWSPDGSQLAVLDYDTGDIRRVNYDGTAPSAPLVHAPASTFAWSPTGDFVVYDKLLTGPPVQRELFRQSWTGGDEEQLTDAPDMDQYPSISPDGRSIAFVAGGDIYTQDASGLNSNRTNISNSPTVDEERPDWSPDGRRIAFDADPTGDVQVFTMDPDGGNVVQLTDEVGEDSDPCWSPDGSKIVFVSYRDDSVYGDLYMMNADGSNVIRLTSNGPQYETDPDSSPPVLNHPRTYVGGPGSDRETSPGSGFDPPFGASIDGAILMRNQTPRRPPDTDCVAFDVDSGETVTINRLSQPGAVYEVTATANFLGMAEDRQAGHAPLMWIGPTPAPIATDTVADLVLVFDPYTGRLTDILPVVGAGAKAAQAFSFGGVTLRGQFLGRAHRDGDELVWIPAS